MVPGRIINPQNKSSMNTQMLKFPFTASGVAQWQQWLAGSTPVQRNDEANCVEQGLYTFVPARFALDATQVAFLDSLPPTLCALWAAQIAYAIREQLPITLIKPENNSGMQPMGVKFIESEGSSGNDPNQQEAMASSGSGYFLRFTISY